MEKDGPPTPLQEALRSAIAASGETRDHFDSLIQKRTGTKGKPIYDIDRGKSRRPSIETLHLIAEVMGKPRGHFVPIAYPIRGERLAIPDQAPTRSASADDNTVEITQLDLSLSMGPGTVIDDYVEGEPVKFDISFLRQITRSEFGRLRLVRGIGDSMYPTLNGGDAIMIDTTQRALSRQDGVYWVSIHGAAGIKRLRTVGPKRILVVSDNPTVGNYEVDANDVRIEGRAIWFARDL